MKIKALTRVKEKRKHSRVNLYSFLRNRVLPLAIVFMFIAQIGTPFFVSAENNTNYGSSKQAPDSNATVVYVDTWSDIEKLGSKEGDAYVIRGNYTIILKEDLVACSPIIFERNVHISAVSNKTIYREKGNTDFTVFTVNSGGHLTLANNVVMTGEVANNYEKVYTLTVTDGVGNIIYKKHVNSNDSRSVENLLTEARIYVDLPDKNVIFEEDAQGTQGTNWDAASWSLNNDVTRNYAFNYLLSSKNDSPTNLGYVFYGWNYGGVDKGKTMAQIDGDVTVVAEWKGHYLFKVTDGCGNTIYEETLNYGETRSCEDIMREAGLLNETTRNEMLQSALQDKSSPYTDGYIFKEWNYGEVLPTRPHNQLIDNGNLCPSSITVIAKWKEPEKEYKLIVTDGFGNSIYVNNNVDKSKTVNKLMSEANVGNLTTQNGRTSAFNNTIKNNSSSPYYENNGVIEYDFISWDYGNDANGNAINGNTTMSAVGGNLTVGATWKKKYTFTVTDGYGNIIYQKKNISTSDNSTVQSLMQNASVGNLLNESSRNSALANQLSGKESPYEYEYTWNSWNYGKDINNNDITLSTTMSSLGGDLTVCAKWDEPTGMNYVWEIPDPLDNNTIIEIGINGRFFGVNSSDQAEWADNYDNSKQQWLIKNLQDDGTFELVNNADESLKVYVENYSYDKGTLGWQYKTRVLSAPISGTHSRFKFYKDENNNVYLTCTDSFSTYQGFTTKTVYMIYTSQPIQAVYFCQEPNASTMVQAGIPKSPHEFEDPDTPGYSEVDGFVGTPDVVGQSEASSSVHPTSGCDINNPSDPSGKQNACHFIEDDFTQSDTPGRTKNNTPSSEKRIDSSTIEDARYATNDDNTQKFNQNGKGFFVQVNNDGTLDIEGATLNNLKTGELDESNTVKEGTSVTDSAPVVVDGGSLNFSAGQIINNQVGYMANDSLSGKQVTGGNVEGWSVKDYISSKAPTRTAGGIIFTNGAKGVITGESYIRQNQGDVGGILVNGNDTDVTIGGVVEFKVINQKPEDESYYILGTDGIYYVVNEEDESLSDELPQGVEQADNLMYDAEVHSTGGGHVDQNVGFHYAGAALVENGATLRMVGEGSTMNNNVTWNRGGAVYATEFGTGGDGTGVKKDFANKKILYEDETTKKKPINQQPYGEGTFIMTNGEISGNTAFVRGGGINVESNRVFLISGTISDNYCRALGGGIYVEGDYADYTYTLVINKGYVGTNYAVRFWDLDNFDSAENNVNDGMKDGNYNDYSLSQMNDILDRKLGHPDPDGNPLATDPTTGMPIIESNGDYVVEIAKGEGYPNRTADARDFYQPHQGNGGGIWLCPIGGTAVFHMNSDNEVIIDDNYASGNNPSDTTKGTDLYLHSGTGHMLVQNDLGQNGTFEVWINEDTGQQIPENGPVYSGPLYLQNITDPNTVYGDTTYGARKDKEEHEGIHIVNNISRDGGGIAADGTLIFGLPNDVYKHDAELEFEKLWPKENAAIRPVRFKMYYLDEEGKEVELPEYAFGLDGSNSSPNDYDFDPENGSSNDPDSDEYTKWRARVTIPISVEIPDSQNPGFTKAYPMYKLQYTGVPFDYTIINSATESNIRVDNEPIDPSTTEGMKKLFAISEHDKENGTETHLKIVEWKLVLKEFDEEGNPVANAEFLNISSHTVTISNDNSIPIDVIDAGGVGKTIKGYNMNFCSVDFIAKVKNNNGPTIEKYINNKVHQDLVTFDETFEYEIMAYVPLDADEIIIYDTLEDPLMFLSSKTGNPQYNTTSNTVNSEFEYEFDNDKKFFIIYNDSNVKRLAIYESNNHYGDGTGTVSVDSEGIAFTRDINGVIYDTTTNPNKNNPMNAGNVNIGTLTYDSKGNVNGVTPSASGNSLFIKIDNTSGIEAVRGKWVRVIFDAAIKPAYRDLEKLKEIGWLTNNDSKVGSPVYYEQKILFEGAGWDELEGIEEIVGKQFITKVVKGGNNTTHIFAMDEFGDYYAKKKTDGIWKRLSEDGVNPENIATAKDRLAGGNGFNPLALNKTITYVHYDAQFVDQAKYMDGSNEVEGVSPVAGAYGSGDWMFVKDVDGNYWYSVKSDYFVKNGSSYQTEDGHFVLKDGVELSDIVWKKVNETGNPNISFVDNKIFNDDSSIKMDLISYNWPIVDETVGEIEHISEQPHQGEANQASMVVNAKNTYNSNIVTIDILQPEKYVNDKVHEILRHDQEAEGAFDQVFEYEIMVYVPEEANEIVIWDTLRDDLMFVDRHGKTQYKTYTIGTQENPVTSSSHGRDIFNDEEFMIETADDSNIGMTLIANDGKSIDPENDRNNHQLQRYTTNNHKGDGTGTVSEVGVDEDGPILNTGYIGLVKEENIPENWDTLPENDREGNTIFIKIDEETGIDRVRGQWVKVTFFAQIKPTSYFDIIDKLQKSSRHTNDKTQVVDYNQDTNPNPSPVGYNYRTSDLTTLKMNAKGYDLESDTVPNSSIKGYYSKNTETGYYTEFSTTQPAGNEGEDWIYAYESAFVYHTERFEDIPLQVRNKGTSEYEAVYLKAGWNDTDDTISWEKVTDDGYVKDGVNLYRNNNTKEAYLDVQADGSHAGLANAGKYAIKIGNDWKSIDTNTVTVVPLLRTITVKKIWVVGEEDPIPSAHELLESLHLYWERITNLDDTQSSDHGRTVGEITELYKHNISIVQEKVEDITGKTRYTWRIEVKDLPQLRPSMKYFIEEENVFDGFNSPRYLNPSDPEATEHAHDTGSIINSKDSDETELLVTKKWDVGSGDYENKTIKVRLLADGEPIWKRDSQGKIIKDNDNNKVVDDNPKYLPIEINSEEDWFILFDVLPKYQRDDNGDYITTTRNDRYGNEIKDKTGQPVLFNVPIVYSIEVLDDPDGYMLSVISRETINYIETTTENIQEAADFYSEKPTEPENIIHWKASAIGFNIYESFDDGSGYYVFDPTPIAYHETVDPNDLTTIYGERIVACDMLPETGIPDKCYTSVYRKYETYTSYEVDLVNTKPQIEKYINKDVHHEAFISNTFTYDIIVYVPEEATEIEIVDELLPTLVLKSLEQPIISGSTSKEITGYDSIAVNSLPTEITLAVHDKNNHNIYGTVNSETVFGDVKGNAEAYGNGFKINIENIVPYASDYYVDSDGEYILVKDESNKTYYKKSNELEYAVETQYDKTETDSPKADSVYVRCLNNTDLEYSYITYKEYLESKQNNPDKYTWDPEDVFYTKAEYQKVNNNNYRIKNTQRYVEDDSGDYVKYVDPYDNNRIVYVEKNTTPSQESIFNSDKNIYKDYVLIENKYYSLVDSKDQCIGGKCVQVTFKAGFNLEKDEEIKQWVKDPLKNFKTNPDLDWDIITDYSAGVDGNNKGWDEAIKYGLAAAGLPTNTKYIEAERSVDNVALQLANAIGSSKIRKIVKSDNPKYYGAVDTDGNYYLYPIAGNQSDDLKNRWLYVAGGPVYYELDRETEAYHGAQGVGLGGVDEYRHNPLMAYVSNNNSIVSSNSVYVPVEPDEFVKINDKYYLREVAKLYAPDYDDSTATIYRKVDWGRGDGDVIRNYPNNISGDKYTGNHAGVVNTASYEVTYGNGYKSNHKSNTVTVVPVIYELPSSGGMGTFLFNILGVMFITIALTEFVLSKHKKKMN